MNLFENLLVNKINQDEISFIERLLNITSDGLGLTEIVGNFTDGDTIYDIIEDMITDCPLENAPFIVINNQLVACCLDTRFDISIIWSSFYLMR